MKTLINNVEKELDELGLKEGMLRIVNVPYGWYRVEMLHLEFRETKKWVPPFRIRVDTYAETDWRPVRENGICLSPKHDYPEAYYLLNPIAKFKTEKEAEEFINWLRSEKNKIV